MFSDPEQVAPYGTDPKDVYPNTMFLPSSGVQRGSTLLGYTGDPLSPTWPSVEGAFRNSLNETDGLPKIPSQPIGYGDAKRLLEIMGGNTVPDDWRGAIPGIQYKLGPGFDENHKEWKVQLVVNNYLDDTKSDNVIGIALGEEEPDRYVIVGNHRDAWGYGAVDPGTGTAPILEIARVLGQKMKEGWRPRRSIVLANWGAEESMVMGSNEWVVDKVHKLTNRAAAYLNMDACVQGGVLNKIFASSVLKDVAINALKGLKSPGENSGESYFEFLEEYYKMENTSVADKIKIVGSGSDHAGFAFYAGVPATFHIAG